MVYLPIDATRFGANLFSLPGFLYGYEAQRLGLANTNPVTTFAERFGTRDMASLSSPALATYSAAGINGRAAVSYPRLTGQQHRGGNANPFAGQSGLTVYAVISHDQVTTNGAIVGLWNSASSVNRVFNFRVLTTGAISTQVYVGGVFRSLTSSFTVAANTPTVVAMRFNGTTNLVRAGSSVGTSTAFTAGTINAGQVGAISAVFSIGANSNTSNNTNDPYRGLLGAVYLYLDAHSTADMDYAVAELSARYGI
jgi:hypothetical protein